MGGMKRGTVDRACETFVQTVPAKPRVQTNCCILRHGIHVAPHIQLQLHCLYTAHSKSVAGDKDTTFFSWDATPQMIC